MSRQDQWQCPILPNDIEKEYNFVAQDKYGEWWAFKHEPTKHKSFFWCDRSYPKLLGKGKVNLEWRKTLKKIPR
jgi:hypothetical protein